MTIQLVKAIPSSWYYEPSIYELEQRNIFRKEWLYAAHTREILEPGCFVTQTVAGYPIFILRDHDGTVKAYHNFCRHRGAPLVLGDSGRLTGQKLICRYHGWSYDFKGQFNGGPHCDGIASQERTSLRLCKIRLHIYRGMIFLNFSDESSAFTQTASAFIKALDESKYSFEKYDLHSRISYSGCFNWKTWIDGLQEHYRSPSILANSQSHLMPQRNRVENFDRYSVHSFDRSSDSHTGEQPSRCIWVFPSLAIFFNQQTFYTLQVEPTEAQRTRLTYTVHFEPSYSPQKIHEFMTQLDKMTKENMSICEQVQKNYASGIMTHCFLHPHQEIGVAYFHNLIRNTLSEVGPVQPVATHQLRSDVG